MQDKGHGIHFTAQKGRLAASRGPGHQKPRGYSYFWPDDGQAQTRRQIANLWAPEILKLELWSQLASLNDEEVSLGFREATEWHGSNDPWRHLHSHTIVSTPQDPHLAI
ncbi:predicted protein [Histoplasma capsulatum var. duboisii H88]|uniref:Predicted protein n=1 Tax=Ajellomyces capsulatus (strain H88) TaxID=544711 RepID=F0URH4_AJEC8|nr:predicted protein [Histoplasma capsulatum var. duboisii H88]